jgi:hypothetical protein
MPQNPDQSHPSSKADAPNPAYNYERAIPARESPPQGELDRPKPDGVPVRGPDPIGPESTSRHTNKPNSDSLEYSTSKGPETDPAKVDHSMKQEEPTGWDQAPTDIHDPQQQRHPRTEGKGGVP